MRVLHVHSGNLYGGIETFLVTFARCRHLCPSMQMSVPLCFDGRLSNELSAAGVPVDFLDELRAEAATLSLGSRVGFTGFVPDSSPALRARDIVVPPEAERDGEEGEELEVLTVAP